MGATFTNTFLLITLEKTVQKEAQRINRSPIEKEKPSELTLRTTIPKKPTKAAMIFLTVGLSSLINRKEKQTQINIFYLFFSEELVHDLAQTEEQAPQSFPIVITHERQGL